MGFQLIPKSVTLSDLEQHNDRGHALAVQKLSLFMFST